jgi:tRNA pseudouridine55 synthase
MAKRKKGRDISGIVLLDKSLGISSNKALQNIKHLYQAQKAGHTGSLDPLASGLLPICLGEATKFSRYFLNADKCYTARLQLGQKTSTADSEGDLIESKKVEFAFEVLVEVLSQFVGHQKQVPSMFSALKHEGQPLYKLARKGLEIDREARDIFVKELRLLSDRSLFESSQQIDIYVHCSKGTYIRNLAEDIGEEAGCGAHLLSLHRDKVGDFSDMYSEQELKDLYEQCGFDAIDQKIMPIDQALAQFPPLCIGSDQTIALKSGLTVEGLGVPEGVKGMVRVYEEEKQSSSFIGLGEYDTAQSSLKAKRLLRTDT